MDKMINMFVRLFVRKAMSKGIDAGFRMAEQQMGGGKRQKKRQAQPDLLDDVGPWDGQPETSIPPSGHQRRAQPVEPAEGAMTD